MAEALLRYVDHIESYDRNPDGTPTGTAEDIKITLGYLRRLFAHLPLSEFDIRCFKALRQERINDGRVRNQVIPIGVTQLGTCVHRAVALVMG